ncbi:hypothetical protein NOJ28_03710 [Neorhizobium galegae]|uniref:hypothetical protein n=1 Tax=Neorhizobium galegae TaxID=399 RepID=UPI0006210874|nr:hypothetical protein [Neorhizobium galegae]MCQ1764628.1 hypothetical protein [Neorhizobium galegae]MCQ1847742.1 hypothetical protein [Neorhizobium galegae]CDZ37505.1 Hypothetical protein NGAL_HAMBI1146_23950 [Neorhizobium galegae bv. officinalis]
MSFPEPKPGLVIRYAFLWSSDEDRGSVEAAKDRPCAIVVAAYNQAGAIQTIVAPVTHSPPHGGNPKASLEIPAAICRSLGFDDGRHWLRLDELNRFLWPGYDLRPRPDDASRWDYGMLPKDFFEQVRGRIIDLDRERKNRIMKRD